MNDYDVKARELYEKYKNIAASFGSIQDWHKNTKKCCNIAIDEVISACEFNSVESWNTDWWNKVRTSLNAL